jgi:AraC-like DNA-binding protein
MPTSRRSQSVGHALLAPGLANAFEMLRVSAAIRERSHWRLIHYEPYNLLPFEAEHGVEHERDGYNSRCIGQATRQRQPILGRHAGLSDWFVPIVAKDHVKGVLITGPFVTARPTSTEILERWRWLTGRQGHPADPEFAHYFAVTLSTLVLEGDRVAIFGRFLSRLAKLLAGEGRAETLLAEAEPLRNHVELARFGDRMWDMARSMVDERTSRSWSSPQRSDWLASMGLSRFPDQALVGLAVSRRPEAEPVDDLLQRHTFQRACVELARNTSNVISGQIGDHGVMFLSAWTGSNQRKRQRLLDVGNKAIGLARRSGLELHVGLSPLSSSARLDEHYEAALGAAESALSQGMRMLEGLPRAEPSSLVLGQLRRELAELVEQRPGALPVRFDRYLESVAMNCGYRLDPARAHLVAGFEDMVEALRRSHALEGRSLADMRAGLERAVREARTVSELFAAHRRVVVDISEAAERPGPAHQDRSLRRAMTFIHQHFSEPLRLDAVARVAGFAPNYFSHLFKERERMTFARYVQNMRLERAKRLLTSTKLEMQQVARLSGFGTGHYLARVFRRSVGMPPIAYREGRR